VPTGWSPANVAIDASHLYSRFSDAPNEPAAQARPLYPFWVVVGMGAFAVFARPRVEVGPDQVVLRNVFRDVYVPIASIEELDDSARTVPDGAVARSSASMIRSRPKSNSWSKLNCEVPACPAISARCG
jgi:Bacterial PH domain